MALPATAIWEVRPTVGSDTNGGGFDSAKSGTDYSQQNSANSGGNNSSTTDAASASAGTLTSATASFTSAIVGNIIYISGSGATTGWYEVTSFTNSTTVVLDRSPGTGTGWTMNIGGAFATISNAYSAAVVSNTIYIKATGSYTVTATLTLNKTSNTPFTFIGYTSTRGDGGRITWTTATNSVILVTLSNNMYNHCFQNINFTNTSGTPGNGFDGGLTGQGAFLRFRNCVFSGFAQGLGIGFQSGVHYNCEFVFLEDCEIKSCITGLHCSGPTFLIGCFIHGNSGNGIDLVLVTGGADVCGPLHLERSVVYNNGGVGIQTDTSNTTSIISNPSTYCWIQLLNSAVVSNTGDGVYLNSGASGGQYWMMLAINSIIQSNGGYGINNKTNGSGYFNIFYNNAYRNNTSGNYNNLLGDSTDITLTADPFTSASTGDFSLNTTAGGGVLLKAAGFQGTLNGATDSGMAIDVGVVQTESSGGGSHGIISALGWSGGFEG